MRFREEEVPVDSTVMPNSERRSRPTFTFVSPTQLFKALPPRPHFVNLMLPKGAIVGMGGYGESGKSWGAYSLALSVVHGEPWLGRFAVKKSPASILDYEMGDFESHRRIQTLTVGLGAKATSDIALCVYPKHALNSAEFVLALEQAVDRYPLVVIDSLRAATPGMDENDSSIRRYIDELRRLSNFNQVCIILLAHARKGGNGELREQLRGSGAIFDAVNQLFHFNSEGDFIYSVQQTKSRFGAPIPPFQFRIEDVPGAPICGVRLVEVAPAKNGVPKPDTKSRRTVTARNC